MLLGSFIFAVVTPLVFAHLYDLTASHSLCRIQNPNAPLAWQNFIMQKVGVT
jgi:hypothetical protein